MRDCRDLQVWEKAHKLTLAIYRGTQRLSIRGTIWVDQSDLPLGCLDCGKLGGRQWPRIGWRNGSLYPDFNGFWRGTFVPLVARTRLGFVEESGIFEPKLRPGRDHENAVVAFAKD
jgi:hypothetical protein